MLDNFRTRTRRLGWAAFWLILSAFPAAAMQRVQVPCTVGGKVVVTSAVNSTTRVQASYPSCTVTAYVTASAQVASATYLSGITTTGTTGQTCLATFGTPVSGGGLAATASIALTGNNSIAANTAFTILTGGGYSSPPISATITSGTATCSGTASLSSSLGSLTKATIYSDNNFTPLSNPFTANTSGYGYFYVPDGYLDIVISGGSPTSIPTPYTFGGTNIIDAYFQAPGAAPFTAGTVPRLKANKLAESVSIMDFGAVCDGSTDDYPAISAAIAYIANKGGGVVYVPNTLHLCGSKHSIDLPFNHSVTIRGQWPSNVGGFLALPGGTWSTYTSALDSTVHTYFTSIGGGTCNGPVAYSSYLDVNIYSNLQTDVTSLNRCGQENSTYSNVLLGGAKFTELAVETFQAQNSDYENLTIYPGSASTYGITVNSISRVAFNKVTVNGALSGTGNTTVDGILSYGGQNAFRDIHTEHTNVGIDVTGGSAWIEHYDFNAQGVVGVSIGASSNGALINYEENGALASGPFVRDYLNQAGAILNTYDLAFYYSVKSTYGGSLTLMSSDPQINWIVPNTFMSASLFANSLTIYNDWTAQVDASGGGALVEKAALSSGFFFRGGPGLSYNGGTHIGVSFNGDPSCGSIGAGVLDDTGTFTAQNSKVTGATATASGAVMCDGAGYLWAKTALTNATSFTPTHMVDWTPTYVRIGTPLTFSALPTCATALEGAENIVTDSTTVTWGATVTGSGSNHIKAYCDGTNWTVMAK